MRTSTYLLLLWVLAATGCTASSAFTENRSPDYRASQVHISVAPRIPAHQQRHMDRVEAQLRQGQALSPRDSFLVRKYLPDYWPASAR